MITEDRRIDPRIIQQAVALQLTGCHVILIAKSVERSNSFEWLQEVRVERFCATPSATFDKIVSRTYQQLTSLCRFFRESEDNSYLPLTSQSITATSRTLRLILNCIPNRSLLSFEKRSLVQRIRFYHPDAIYVYDLGLLRLSTYIARDLSISLTYGIREPHPSVETFSPWKRFRRRRTERKFMHRCDVVTTVSSDLAKEFNQGNHRK